MLNTIFMKRYVLFVLSFLLIVFSCLGQSMQCKGITQKGERCKRMTTNTNGFCYQHQNQIPNQTKQGTTVNSPGNQAKDAPKVKSTSATSQCKGITKKGERCKRMTTNSKGYCSQHQSQVKEE